MVAQVTMAEVKALLAPYADASDDVITLAIEQANLIKDEDLAGKGLSATRLRVIELNLAAHFAVLSVERGGFTFQRTGNSEEGYAQDRRQVRFSSTRYGQQAVAMDTTGSLALQDAPKGNAEFRVVEAKDYIP